MTGPEKLAMKALIDAAKGARDTLDAIPEGTKGVRDSRVARDLRRLDKAIASGDAMMAGAGQR